MNNNQYPSYGGCSSGGSSGSGSGGSSSYANSYGGGGSSSSGGSSSYANSYGGGGSSSYANSYGGGGSSYANNNNNNNNNNDDYDGDEDEDEDEEDYNNDDEDNDDEDNEDEDEDEDDDEEDEEYEPDPEAGEGYCSCGNICLVNSNRGLCVDCRNVSVRFGENTEHETYASHRAVGYPENEKYDRSYRSYQGKGYRRKDTEYDCITCEDGLVDNHYGVPNLIYCNSCLGYYSKERAQSYHKDEDWQPIEREDRAEWYEAINAYRAKNGLPLI